MKKCVKVYNTLIYSSYITLYIVILPYILLTKAGNDRFLTSFQILYSYLLSP